MQNKKKGTHPHGWGILETRHVALKRDRVVQSISQTWEESKRGSLSAAALRWVSRIVGRMESGADEEDRAAPASACRLLAHCTLAVILTPPGAVSRLALLPGAPNSIVQCQKNYRLCVQGATKVLAVRQFAIAFLSDLLLRCWRSKFFNVFKDIYTSTYTHTCINIIHTYTCTYKFSPSKWPCQVQDQQI